jgi:hypothetical protein
MAEGVVSPDVAATALAALAHVTSAIETTELEARIAKLEAALLKKEARP